MRDPGQSNSFRVDDEIREKQGGASTKIVLAVEDGESIEVLSSRGRRTTIGWAQLPRYEVVGRQ